MALPAAPTIGVRRTAQALCSAKTLRTSLNSASVRTYLDSVEKLRAAEGRPVRRAPRVLRAEGRAGMPARAPGRADVWANLTPLEVRSWPRGDSGLILPDMKG